MEKIIISNGHNEDIQVLLAHTWLRRLRGLLGKRLLNNQVMHISPCNSIHTMWMAFNIDVVFLDRKNQVIKIEKNVKPWRFRSCVGAFSVMEINAGQAEVLGFKVGKKINAIGDVNG